MRFKLSNSSGFDDELVLEIASAVAPGGLAGTTHLLLAEVDGHRGGGEAYGMECEEHSGACHWVHFGVARSDEMARDSGSWREEPYRKYAVGSRLEVLVAVLSHELFHCWQAEQQHQKPFSERDADNHAIRQLRRFRRGDLLGAD